MHKKGYEIILIGHKNHPEVVGTMGQLPSGSIHLIETIDEAKSLNPESFKKPVAYITQTTLSVDDTAEIIKMLKEKFAKIGIIDENNVVFSCGSGITASVLGLAYSMINDKYLPTVYDGSWVEYGKIK